MKDFLDNEKELESKSKSENEGSTLNGFDSAQSDKQPVNGYTVTPSGSFFESKPAESAIPDEDIALFESEPEKIEVAEPKESEMQPTLPNTAEEQQERQPKFGYFPSGTYSYSAPDTQYGAGFETPPPVSKPKRQKRPKKDRKYGLGAVVLSAILAAVIGASAGVGAFYYTGTLNNNSTDNQSSTSSTPTGTSVTNIKVDKTVASVVEAVAEKAGPSVIGIRTTAAVAGFFGGSENATGEGSGIIYKSDGYIITNYHVIQGAVEAGDKAKIEVFLPSAPSTAIEATVVGYNISSDLAVVKVNKTGLTPVEIANSDNLKVGQFVVAIGNPGGLEFMGSVSYGILSGLNRSISLGTGSTMSLIQTDAAINPGNSGGALVNTDGKLIGVNSVKLVNESYEGMGFAIPVNTVIEICNRIISKQNEPTPYIGIEISQSYTASTLQMLGYPAGAVVVSVVSGGPADDSGVQRGDIITEFNGKAISSYATLNSAIADCSPGDTVVIKIYRSGRFYSTNVRVEANNAQ